MPVADVITREIEIPPKVKVVQKDDIVRVSGPLGELERKFSHPKITVRVDKKNITVNCNLPRRKEYALIGTWNAHLNNMINGVTKGFKCNMKIVYSHFPIKTSVKGEEFIIENFIGEKHPRKCRLLTGTKVTISGDQVNITGPDIEKVMQTAANIEQCTRIRGFDNRVFQDGIYIVNREYWHT